MKNLNFRSAWCSPRGFANEGIYLYGTIEEMENFFADRVAGDINSDWGGVKHHKTLENAQARCEKEARQDNNRHRRCNEISAISAISAENCFGV